MSGLGQQAGGLAGQALPMAMLIASNYMQGNQAQKTAQQAQQGSLNTWQQNAYPKPEVVNAAATKNRGQLGQARLGAYQNLASNMAARGFGSGSGIMAGGAQGIEKGYLQGLGKQATDMTKFANTPMFGMPQSAYPTPVAGGPQQALGGLDTALGYYAMLQAMKGYRGYA